MSRAGRVVVRGIGVVGAFGCGIARLSDALQQGPAGPVGLALTVGSEPREITVLRADTTPLEAFVPARSLRRLDHYSRLALLASHLALADAGPDTVDPDRLGVVVATGHGATGNAFTHLRMFLRDGDACASPTHFANSLHSSAASSVSMMLRATGPNLTVSQLDLSVPCAVLTALQWLLEGRVEHVLCGALDEMSELMGYLWYRQRGMPASPAMTPLCTRAESAVPAEGAAFVLLSREEGGAEAYCTLERVDTGGGADSRLFSHPPDLLVLAADGRLEAGPQYAALAAHARVACYSPLYGSTPAGPAFDVAAAALILRHGRVFGSPGGEACDFPATVARAGEPFGGSTVDCLTLTPDGGYGLITAGRR